MTGYSPLLACYGGGHAQIISVLAMAMTKRGLNPRVIGFTTAYRSLRRAGIDAFSVEALLEPEDERFLEAAGQFIGPESHPDVTTAETRAYYAIGLHDLVTRLGWNDALQAIGAHGRKAFEPTTVLSRYLQKTRPDIVVTTTSPRFELAMLRAGRALGIPTLAVGDLFLVKESEWIVSPGYAQNLAVLSDDVAEFMATKGYPPADIRVTGNPAFDSLAPGAGDERRRAALREAWNLTDKTVVLWPAPGSAMSMIGRAFQPVEQVISALEGLCAKDPSFSYVYRTHPNTTGSEALPIVRGRLDQGALLPEEALLIADIVCVEASTMGLQAAIRGLPVICIGFADYVMYPQFGLAQSVDSLEAAMELIVRGKVPPPSKNKMPPVGNSTELVLSFIEEIVSSNRKAAISNV
jgi:Lipid A disaccharide synthetase